MTEKKGLDTLVFEKGFAGSCEKARTLITLGDVYVDNQKLDKPGIMFPTDAAIEVHEQGLRHVSCDGLKPEKTVELYVPDLSDPTCMGTGASTGGFTDYMLQDDAEKVYSADVGCGQLAWKLRTDTRMVDLERTNVRCLTPEQVPDPVDFFSVDVSFIPLALVLPVAKIFLPDNARTLCPIKPQFEAGHENVGKKDVVRDQAVHEQMIVKIRNFVLVRGFSILGLTFSPVKESEGNVEYLIYLQKSGHPEDANG